MEIQRFELDGVTTQNVRTEPESGDLLFDVIGVDKAKTPNRKGAIFAWEKPEDVILDTFKLNPIMLWRHDDWSLPIGRWEAVQVTAKQLKLSGRIPNYSNSQVEAERELDKFIGMFRALVRDKYLRACSIGFYVRRSEEQEMADGGQNRFVTKIISFELVECSLCPIGAHATAIIQGAPTDALRRFAQQHEIKGAWDEQTTSGERMVRLSLDAHAPGKCAPTGQDTPNALRNVLQQPSAPQDARRGQSANAQNADPAAGAWNALREGMGKALGARGATPDAPAHAALAAVYKSLGVEAPPWRENYTPAELAQLHADGVLIVPGRAASAQQQEKPPADLAALTAQIEALSAKLDSLTCPSAETKQTPNAGDPAAAASSSTAAESEAVRFTPEEKAAAQEAVRRIVTQTVSEDPALRAQRQGAVDNVIRRIREKHAHV